MKTIIAMLLLCGCANVKMSKTLPDGSVVKAEYTRWFNQNIDGFEMETPEGYKIRLDRQKSDVEIALEYAGAKISVGGD